MLLVRNHWWHVNFVDLMLSFNILISACINTRLLYHNRNSSKLDDITCTNDWSFLMYFFDLFVLWIVELAELVGGSYYHEAFLWELFQLLGDEVVWTLYLLGEVVLEVGVLVYLIWVWVLEDSDWTHLDLVFWWIARFELSHLILALSCYIAGSFHPELVVYVVASLVSWVAVVIIFSFLPFVDNLPCFPINFDICKIKDAPLAVFFSLSKYFNMNIFVWILDSDSLWLLINHSLVIWTSNWRWMRVLKFKYVVLHSYCSNLLCSVRQKVHSSEGLHLVLDLNGCMRYVVNGDSCLVEFWNTHIWSGVVWLVPLVRCWSHLLCLKVWAYHVLASSAILTSDTLMSSIHWTCEAVVCAHAFIRKHFTLVLHWNIQ